MLPSLARVKFIKTKVIFRYHTKGVSNQVSSNWDHAIKSYSCSNVSTKMRKNETMGKIFWVTKWDNKGITNRGGIQRLEIEAKGITNRGSSNGFQIGAKGFQIVAGTTNRGRDYKSAQNRVLKSNFMEIQPLKQWLKNVLFAMLQRFRLQF